MTEPLVEKGAAAERECMKSWGDDLGQPEARMRARAVLAAVWPDLPAARPVVDAEALVGLIRRSVLMRATTSSESEWATRLANAILASDAVQHAADVRRVVAEEIAQRIEENGYWAGALQGTVIGRGDAARIAREAGSA